MLKSRNPYLDAMRFILSTLIVVQHFGGNLNQLIPYPFESGARVSFYMFLAGIFSAKLIPENAGIKGFFRDRVLRIAPLYYIAFFTILVIDHNSAWPQERVIAFWGSLFCVQSLIPGKTAIINNPAWFLSALLVIQAAHYILVQLGRNLRIVLTTIAFLAGIAGTILTNIIQHTQPELFQNTVIRDLFFYSPIVPGFQYILGYMLGKWLTGGDQQQRAVTTLLVSGIVSISFLILHWINPAHRYVNGATVSFAVAIFCCCLLLPAVASSNRFARAANYLGTCSYAIYLFQGHMSRISYRLFGDTTEKPVLFFISLGSLILVSIPLTILQNKIISTISNRLRS